MALAHPVDKARGIDARMAVSHVSSQGLAPELSQCTCRSPTPCGGGRVDEKQASPATTARKKTCPLLESSCSGHGTRALRAWAATQHCTKQYSDEQEGTHLCW